MGFFKNLFSSKKKEEEEEESEIRAEHKDYKYFLKQLNVNENIIETLTKDNLVLKEKGEFNPFNDWGVSMEFLDKIYIKYSLNQKMSVIKNDYLTGLEYYIKGWDEEDATYSDMIGMISLAILFEVSDAEINQLIEYVNKTESNSNLKDWKPDYLLGYLLNSRNFSKTIPDSILIPSLYQKLVDITKLNKDEAQIKMKEYLEKWYGLHKNDPWYNNHKKQSGYKGYWCWEAAAVVKVMKLDDTPFKDHPHYPYDMVHWQDNESV